MWLIYYLISCQVLVFTEYKNVQYNGRRYGLLVIVHTDVWQIQYVEILQYEMKYVERFKLSKGKKENDGYFFVSLLTVTNHIHNLIVCLRHI